MVGRLLLLTAPWHHLRPLLIPLYKALHTTPTTMVGIDQVSFVSLLDMVSDDLVLQSSLTSLPLHHSLNPGTKIQRAANTFVATKTDLAAVHVKSRRVWLGVADPSSPTRLVDADAWQEILSSTSTIMSMRSPQCCQSLQRLMQWLLRRWQVWGVLPLWLMDVQFGFNSEFH